jgi:hypothetical protein
MLDLDVAKLFVTKYPLIKKKPSTARPSNVGVPKICVNGSRELEPSSNSREWATITR